MKWWWFSFALWLLPVSSKAQLVSLREHARQLDSGKFSPGVDFAMFFGERESSGYTFVAPTGLATLRLGEAVFELAGPFAYYHQHNDPGEDHDRLAIGNPWLGLAYLSDTSCGLARLSVGLAAPLARGSSGRAAQALLLMRAVHGAWDAYLYESALFPLVFGAGTLKEFKFLRLAWDADAVLGLPGGGRDWELGLQTAGELMLRFAWHTSLAARASVAYYPTYRGDDLQTALTFAFQHRTTRGTSLGARFVINLDRPFGFSFRDDGVWGLSLFYLAAL